MTTRNEIAEQRAEQLPDTDRRLYESFKRTGMSPAAAWAATFGGARPLPPVTRARNIEEQEAERAERTERRQATQRHRIEERFDHVRAERNRGSAEALDEIERRADAREYRRNKTAAYLDLLDEGYSPEQAAAAIAERFEASDDAPSGGPVRESTGDDKFEDLRHRIEETRREIAELRKEIRG